MKADRRYYPSLIGGPAHGRPLPRKARTTDAEFVSEAPLSIGRVPDMTAPESVENKRAEYQRIKLTLGLSVVTCWVHFDPTAPEPPQDVALRELVAHLPVED